MAATTGDNKLSKLATQLAGNRRDLLTQLARACAPATATVSVEQLQRAVAGAEKSLRFHSFPEVNPKTVHELVESYEQELHRHSQHEKKRVFSALVTRLHKMVPEGETDSTSVLAMLCSLACRPIQTKLAQNAALVAQPAPDSESGTPTGADATSSHDSTADAYSAAWQEDDLCWGDDSVTGSPHATRSHSAWHSPDFAPPLELPESPGSVSVFAAEGFEASVRRAPLQFPELPLPNPERSDAYHDDIQPDDLPAMLPDTYNGALSAHGSAVRCFTEPAVAEMCLEVLLGHPDVVFVPVEPDASPASRLRSCALHNTATVLQGAHTRRLSPTALAAAVAPFLRCSAMRSGLQLWVRAAVQGGGRSLEPLVPPDEVLEGGNVNPSLVSFCVALGQQVDVVDAAVQDLEEWLRAAVQLGTQETQGLLSWLRSACAPIMARTRFLYSILRATVGAAIEAGAEGVRARDVPAAQSPRPTGRQACVTQALVDSLHDSLLSVEEMGGRRGGVCTSVLCHLFVGALRPTLDAFEMLLREGRLDKPRNHLCLDVDAAVHPRDPHFWGSAVNPVCDAHGVHVAPRCLPPAVVNAVVGAGKAAAMLRADTRTFDTLMHALRDRMQEKISIFDRVVAALTDVLVAAEADHSILRSTHRNTLLMHQAGEVLADMQREHQNAADGVAAIVAELEEADAIGELFEDTGSPVRAGLGGIAGMEDDMGTLAAAFGEPWGLPRQRGLPAGPVPVEEKVAWMHGGGASREAHQAATTDDDVLLGEKDGTHTTHHSAPWDDRAHTRSVADVVSMHGSYSHMAHSTADEVSEAADADSEPGGLLQMPSCAAHTVSAAGTQGDECEAGGSDSSSDFSYGQSSGEEDEDEATVQERRTLRQARSALQAARRAARRHLGTQMARQIPSPETAGHGRQEQASSSLHADTMGDWERADEELAQAAASQEPLPPVAVADARGCEPLWSQATTRQMARVRTQTELEAGNITYARAHGRTAGLNSLVPGCTSMPAFVPIQGCQATAQRMAEVQTAPTAHEALQTGATAFSNMRPDGLQWQFQPHRVNRPPLEQLLHQTLSATIQASSRLTTRMLIRFMLGECDLKAELARVRAILLLACPAMHTWADQVVAYLNGELGQVGGFKDMSNAAQTAFFHLETSLRQGLEESGVLCAADAADRPVSLQQRVLNPSMLYLGFGFSQSRKVAGLKLSQIAYVDILCATPWPLNIIVTEQHLQSYRVALGALLQLHWVDHNLAALSQALSKTRLRSKQALAAPPPTPSGAAKATPRGSSRLTVAAVGATVRSMRQFVAAVQHSSVQHALDTAWRELCACLDRASVGAAGEDGREGVVEAADDAMDLDGILAAHTRYLQEVRQALWVHGQEDAVQVIAYMLLNTLERALRYCDTVMRLLSPHEARGEGGAQTWQLAQLAQKLATKFHDGVMELKHQLAKDTGNALSNMLASQLSETLNWNGFYDD